MGLRKVLHALDGPTVLCYSMHVLSTTAVPVMTKLLITQIRFPYTATLALTQAVIIAVCLWFWTIFGVFKVRVLSLRRVLPLAVTGALSNVLHLLTLSHGSLLHYQVARLLPLALSITSSSSSSSSATSSITPAASSSPSLSPLPSSSSPSLSQQAAPISTVPLFNSVPLLTGCTVLLMVHPPPMRALCLLSATVAVSLLDRASFLRSARRVTRASELQLQLPIRTLMVLLTVPVVPLVDDYSAASATSIRTFPFDESVTILVFSTGVVAFFAFVAVRASAARLSSHGYRGAAMCSALAVFAAHFVQAGARVGVIDFAAVALALAGALHISLVADDREGNVGLVARAAVLCEHDHHHHLHHRRRRHGDENEIFNYSGGGSSSIHMGSFNSTNSNSTSSGSVSSSGSSSGNQSNYRFIRGGVLPLHAVGQGSAVPNNARDATALTGGDGMEGRWPPCDIRI